MRAAESFSETITEVTPAISLNTLAEEEVQPLKERNERNEKKIKNILASHAFYFEENKRALWDNNRSGRCFTEFSWRVLDCFGKCRTF